MSATNMAFVTKTVGADVEILKRPPFEGVAITLDFTSVTDIDAGTGLKVVKAGSPISAAGVVANTSSAIGILKDDVLINNPQGTILKKAYIDLTVAEANCGLTISADVKAALPMVVFE